ncbi:MAG: ribonuclease H-like domain-containing protein [Chlamydiae bacterium]|nr:ribonuclease H-like domain-containing protein [Chlamydiota bacterium]
MLKKTFCHIKGISENAEKLLWLNGIKTWEDFLAKGDTFSSLPKGKLTKIKDELLHSLKAFKQKDIDYFKTRLKSKEHWRLWEFGKIGFVDIETTGLDKFYDAITVIGIYDGSSSHLFVKDKNLDKAKEKLREFDILVTFNGKQFDLPFIERHFFCKYEAVHLDLRYMFKEIGFQGGLKSIEAQVGIERDSEVKGIDGFEAVNLWHRYRKGNEEALQKLLKYNEHDIVNLKTLLDYYIRKKQELIFKD